MPVSPGDLLLNKYRVEAILGKGGMGVVVAARHVELDELFAIKLMLPALAENREAVERFLREARAAAKLKGDHVVKVHDVGRLPDDTLYMVMDYLTGSDLKAIVREQGALPVDQAVSYVLQACETLREAHAIGIVHRDIKSANLFLARDSHGVPRVKVIDFGILKHTAEDAVGLTATSTVSGSPLYMSPEQMRSSKYVDHRTDIWAIGVVLYELVTGTVPFNANTITAVTSKVLQREPAPPSRLRAGVPKWIDDVVLRCLEKHPDRRFQTISELMEALRAGASGPMPHVETPDGASALPLDTVRLGARPHGSDGSAADAAPLPVVATPVPIPAPAIPATTSTTGGLGPAASLPVPTTASTTGGLGPAASLPVPTAKKASWKSRRHLGALGLIVVAVAAGAGFFRSFRSPAGPHSAAGDGPSNAPQTSTASAASIAQDLPLTAPPHTSALGSAAAPPTAQVVPVATDQVRDKPPGAAPTARSTSTVTAKPAVTTPLKLVPIDPFPEVGAVTAKPAVTTTVATLLGQD